MLTGRFGIEITRYRFHERFCAEELVVLSLGFRISNKSCIFHSISTEESGG